ncbi:MAG: branched-chain amino acid ABC transporter permease [Rhodobacteraceae bacterium]|nr:branched-chain amino acid ABC transporter permease [Paracoccaceae bacterium]
MFRLTPVRSGALGLLAALGLYAAFSAEYFGLEILTEIAILSMLVIALDMVAGFGGMVSLCHGALLGIGAYAYAGLTTMTGADPFLALLGAVVLTGIAGFLVGAVCAGSQGIYFIMVTLAFGQMAYAFFFESAAFGGDDGIAGVPRLDLSGLGVDLGDSRSFVLFCMILLALVTLFAAHILRSGLGRTLVGLKTNEQRMRALGVRSWRAKAYTFGISGMIAGLAGVLAAQHTMYISPGLLNWTVSGEALVVVILGGLGTLVGPLVGATAFVLIKHEVSALTPYWHLVTGVILIAVVMSGANGIFGFFEAQLERLRNRSKPAVEGKLKQGSVHDA